MHKIFILSCLTGMDALNRLSIADPRIFIVFSQKT